MLKVGVMVSGGGTNLQAIIDGVHSGVITNAKLEVVISNKKDAYALTRAKENGIKAESVCIKDYATRDEFNKALIGTIDSYNLDLIVLAGFLVVLPEELINKYRNRIINIQSHLSAETDFMDYTFTKKHWSVELKLQELQFIS